MRLRTLFAALSNATVEDVVRSVVTVGVVGTVLFLYATSRPVDPQLLTVMGLVLGYFFGRTGTLASGIPGQSVAFNRRATDIQTNEKADG